MVASEEQMEGRGNGNGNGTVMADLPALRWELINDIYEKLDKMLSDEVNTNRLTFVEIETVMKLMSLKLLKCEVNHLVGISIGELLVKINNVNKQKACCRQEKVGECYT
jgi:hypothetical protein